MGLKVWLPLDGSLRQLGIKEYTIAAARGNIVYNDNGKIGKCFYSNGVNTLKITNIIPDIYNYSSYSLSAWFYIETNNTSHTGSSIISGGNWNQQLLNLAVSDWSTDHYTKLRISGSNWTRTYNYNFYKNTWYHAVVCDDGTYTYGYVNGTLIGDTAASFLPSSIEGNDIYIGGATYSTSMQFFGKINDVRIYDHCLSAAEVREISQGLVLHYKLDSIDIKTGTNLVTSITKGGQTTLLTDGRIGVETSGINGDTYFTINLSESIVAGTSYFLSCDASGISAGQYWGFPLGQQNNGTLPFKIYNGHNEYVFTANDTLPNGNTMNWGTNRLFMDDNYRQDNANQAQFYNFQLIKIGTGTELIVKDSSGYNYNGIINSNPIISLETRRYNYSISFDGVDDCIKIPFNDIIKDKNYTVSVWTYKTSIGTKNYQTILGGPSGFELEARSSSSTSPLYRIHNWGGGTTAYEFNKWNLFTFVHTDSNSKLYVNGELKITGTSANIPTGNYYIGAWNSVTGQNYEGLMSDFRIYCTALDADTIRQLYEVGAKVGNKGDFHTFELNETNNGREILPLQLTTSYGNHINLWNSYDENGEITLTGGCSLGSPYIPINPSGKKYYFDAEISVEANNQIYLGFQRYDASKTARSNDATIYCVAIKPTTNLSHQHYHLVYDTAAAITSLTSNFGYLEQNVPVDTISFRILNDWSSANNRKMTVHNISLREVSTLQNTKINKKGQAITTELIEMNDKFRVHKNGIIEANEIIEL